MGKRVNHSRWRNTSGARSGACVVTATSWKDQFRKAAPVYIEKMAQEGRMLDFHPVGDEELPQAIGQVLMEAYCFQQLREPETSLEDLLMRAYKGLGPQLVECLNLVHIGEVNL